MCRIFKTNIVDIRCLEFNDLSQNSYVIYYIIVTVIYISNTSTSTGICLICHRPLFIYITTNKDGHALENS